MDKPLKCNPCRNKLQVTYSVRIAESIVVAFDLQISFNYGLNYFLIPNPATFQWKPYEAKKFNREIIFLNFKDSLKDQMKKVNIHIPCVFLTSLFGCQI